MKAGEKGFEWIFKEGRYPFFYWTLALLSCFPIGVLAQVSEDDGNVRASEGGADKIRIRKAKTGSDGSFLNGSMPDSLLNRYFIDEEGRMYKYFLSYEQALAHFNGRGHSRERKNVVQGVIYIRKAPRYEGGFPKHIRTKNSDE